MTSAPTLLPTPSALLQSAASAPLHHPPSNLGGFGSAGNLQRAVSRKLSVWRASTHKAASTAAAAAAGAAQSAADSLGGSSPAAGTLQTPPQQPHSRTALILRHVSGDAEFRFIIRPNDIEGTHRTDCLPQAYHMCIEAAGLQLLQVHRECWAAMTGSMGSRPGATHHRACSRGRAL